MIDQDSTGIAKARSGSDYYFDIATDIVFKLTTPSVNVLASKMTRAVLPAMIAQGGGIIHISSNAARVNTAMAAGLGLKIGSEDRMMQTDDVANLVMSMLEPTS